MRRPASVRRASRPHRIGVVSVEFALVASIVFLLIFAAVEFARLNMLLNSMENAAYEGARRGIIPGATTANVKAETESILNAVGTVNAQVTVTPSTITDNTQQVTVNVRIPLDDNAWVAPQFTSGRWLDRSCTLNRERTAL